jgi:hypothetical protein
MLSTLFVIGCFVAFLALTLIFNGWLLWLGSRWARIPDVTFARALIVVAIFSTVGVLSNKLVAVSGWEETQPVVALAVYLSAMVAAWLIVQRGFRTTFGRAILAWLPTLLVPATLLPIVAFVVKPYVLETYVSPSNGMAPTIVGEHYDSVCPKCRGQLLVRPAQVGRPSGAEAGICERCWQTSWVTVANQTAISGDRFVSIKLLRPRRWDLITFHYPEDRTLSMCND